MTACSSNAASAGMIAAMRAGMSIRTTHCEVLGWQLHVPQPEPDMIPPPQPDTVPAPTPDIIPPTPAPAPMPITPPSVPPFPGAPPEIDPPLPGGDIPVIDPPPGYRLRQSAHRALAMH